MKTLRLHILRHGLTQGNLDGLYVGHTDLPLCDEGRAQLLQMKEDCRYPASAFVFSSPLKRCLQTAEILFPGVRPMVIDALTEYDFGEYDGRSAEELHEKSPIFDRWLRGEPGLKPPFGESNEDFTRRVCTAYARIVEGLLKTGTDNAAIVTHALRLRLYAADRSHALDGRPKGRGDRRDPPDRAGAGRPLLRRLGLLSRR